MEIFRQLVDVGRTTLQQLESMGEINSSLLQAGSVIDFQQDCLKSQSLLKSLSFSDDNGLIRAVSENARETPARQRQSPGSKRALFNDQGELIQPALVGMTRVGKRQNQPVLSVEYDSTSFEPIVQSVLDRVRQDIDIQLPANSATRDQSSEMVFSTGEKQISQSSSIRSGDTQNRQDTFDYQDGVPDQHLMPGQQVGFKANPIDSDHLQRPLTGSSVDIGETPKSNWLKKHPVHRDAAATRLPMDRDLNVCVDDLRKWVTPFYNKMMPDTDAARSGEAIFTKEDRAAKSNYSSSNHLVNSEVLSHPVSTGQKEPKLLSSGKQTHSSQLEQLVHSWGDNPSQPRDKKLFQPTGETKYGMPPAMGNSVSTQSANKNKGVRSIKGKATHSSQLEQLVHRWENNASQPRDKKLAQSTAGKESSVIAQVEPVSVKRADENRVAEPSLDSDHMFITTLERVLKREIRRYGMEEKE